MISAAFFISPDGEIIHVKTCHIETVISQPERFGLSLEQILKEYKETGEPLGLEGKARENILLRLIEQGWIRIRHYPKAPSRTWKINAHCITPIAQGHLHDFADKIVAGIYGFKEQDLDAQVCINQADGTEIHLTIDDLQKFAVL